MTVNSDIEFLKKRLEEALCHYSMESYKKLCGLRDEQIIETYQPIPSLEEQQYQIELELLDEYKDSGRSVLQIGIYISSPETVLGSTLFVYSDGTVKQEGKIYRFIGGVATQLRK
ncbi:hypothetical protein [Solemya velesiana gill symbiont]|nr:hypothetical protein [Solemya velesiana gill symbiont]